MSNHQLIIETLDNGQYKVVCSQHCDLGTSAVASTMTQAQARVTLHDIASSSRDFYSRRG